MSHQGNAAARRLRSLPPTPPNSSGNKEGEQLYNPSVFRYKCIGYLHLTSDQKGSPGVCRGFQSKIERVANMVPDTREASIKKFLDVASDLGTYVDSDDSADQKVKEIYTSRTMIYKDDDWQNMNNNKAKIQPAKTSPFPEEELIDKTEWSCYGSTQVHYLVLDLIPKVRNVPNRQRRIPRDPSLPPELSELQARADEMFDALSQQLRDFDKQISGAGMNDATNKDGNANGKGSDGMESDKDSKNNNDENNKNKNKNKQRRYTQQIVTKIATSSSKGGKICAITPENIGLSIRKIDSAVGHFTVADIGSIRICLETSSSLMGDDNNNNNKGTTTSQRNNAAHELIKNNPNTMKPGSNTVSTKDQAKDAAADKNNNGDDANKKKTLDLKKFYDFSIKVAHQMEHNVMEIKEAMSDDFPARTYNFGTKVVNRVYKTTDQTFTYMGKIFNSWWRSM